MHTQERGMKYVQNLDYLHRKDVINVLKSFFFLRFQNIFHTSIVDVDQIKFCWDISSKSRLHGDSDYVWIWTLAFITLVPKSTSAIQIYTSK